MLRSSLSRIPGFRGELPAVVEVRSRWACFRMIAYRPIMPLKKAKQRTTDHATEVRSSGHGSQLDPNELTL